MTRRLDDLLELLCTDITAEDLEAVEAALRVLQEKVETTGEWVKCSISFDLILLASLSRVFGEFKRCSCGVTLTEFNYCDNAVLETTGCHHNGRSQL